MMSLRRHSNATAGFTLLEAVIAMMLTGMVLVALATITSQWMPNWNRGMVRLQRSEQLALGLERLRADIAASEFVSISRGGLPYFSGTAKSVTFVRTALGPNAGLGLELVRIAEVQNLSGTVLVRTQAPFAPLVAGFTRNNLPRFENPIVLVRPPYRLSFKYAGPDQVWRDSWSEQPGLPSSIKLSVSGEPTARQLSSTAVQVHAAIPQGCIIAKSLEECLASRGSETKKDPS